MLRAPDFRSYPRVYGRDNAFRKTVINIKRLLVHSPRRDGEYRIAYTTNSWRNDDFDGYFLICKIFRRLNEPQHLVRQAVTYLVNEKFLEKSIADKGLTFPFRMDGKSGHIEWNGKIKKWQFIHTSYERITRRKPNGRKIHTKYNKSEEKIIVPDSAWEGYMYCVNDESSSYKEWIDFIGQTPKENICPKCGCAIETDRKHQISKCNKNIVKGIMSL